MIVFVEVGKRSINMSQIATVEMTYGESDGVCGKVELAVAEADAEGCIPVVWLYKDDALAFAKFWRGEAAPGTDYTVKHLCPQITKIHLRLPA